MDFGLTLVLVLLDFQCFELLIFGTVAFIGFLQLHIEDLVQIFELFVIFLRLEQVRG